MMDFLYESTDFDKVRLDIYEKHQRGKITDREKELLLESVMLKEIDECLIVEAASGDLAAMQKVLGIAAGAIAACAAINILAMKVRTRIKIDNTKEYAAIDSDIKASSNRIKKLRGEIQAIVDQYSQELQGAEQAQTLYGSRILTRVNGDDRVDAIHNPAYSARRGEMEKIRAEKLRSIVHEYIQKRDNLEKEIGNLKKLKSRFMTMVRKGASDEEYQAIRDEMDRIMASIESSSR